MRHSLSLSLGRLAVAATVAALAGAACRATTASAPALPCVGHLCTLSVQNNSGSAVAIRYVDSTGRREILGLVPPLEVRTFGIQWVRSAGVRLYAVTRDKATFQFDVPLERDRPTEVNYPDDFTPAADTLAFPAKPRPVSDSGHRVP